MAEPARINNNFMDNKSALFWTLDFGIEDDSQLAGNSIERTCDEISALIDFLNSLPALDVNISAHFRDYKVILEQYGINFDKMDTIADIIRKKHAGDKTQYRDSDDDYDYDYDYDYYGGSLDINEQESVRQQSVRQQSITDNMFLNTISTIIDKSFQHGGDYDSENTKKYTKIIDRIVFSKSDIPVTEQVNNNEDEEKSYYYGNKNRPQVINPKEYIIIDRYFPLTSSTYLAVGWKNHCICIIFELKPNQTFDIILINAGQGTDLQGDIQNELCKGILIFPNIAEKTAQKFLVEYLKMYYAQKFAFERINNIYVYFYNNIVTILPQDDVKRIKIPLQKTGTCTFTSIINTLLFLHQSISDKDLSTSLLEYSRWYMRSAISISIEVINDFISQNRINQFNKNIVDAYKRYYNNNNDDSFSVYIEKLNSTCNIFYEIFSKTDVIDQFKYSIRDDDTGKFGFKSNKTEKNINDDFDKIDDKLTQINTLFMNDIVDEETAIRICYELFNSSRDILPTKDNNGRGDLYPITFQGRLFKTHRLLEDFFLLGWKYFERSEYADDMLDDTYEHKRIIDTFLERRYSYVEVDKSSDKFIQSISQKINPSQNTRYGHEPIEELKPNLPFALFYLWITIFNKFRETIKLIDLGYMLVNILFIKFSKSFAGSIFFYEKLSAELKESYKPIDFTKLSRNMIPYSRDHLDRIEMLFRYLELYKEYLPYKAGRVVYYMADSNAVPDTIITFNSYTDLKKPQRSYDDYDGYGGATVALGTGSTSSNYQFQIAVTNAIFGDERFVY